MPDFPPSHFVHEPGRSLDKHAMQHALPELSVAQLITLYDAARATEDMWNHFTNMPRAGFDGEGARAREIMDSEADRAGWIRERAGYELLNRPEAEFKGGMALWGQRAAIFADMYSRGGEDDPRLAMAAMDGLRAQLARDGVRKAVRS